MQQSLDFGKLKIDITKHQDEVVYTFRGEVDETFNAGVVPKVSASRIVFELSQIENFNSCGIREWIYLIKDISAVGQLVYRRCSVSMIDQINMVPESRGNALIESFYAPYYSEEAGEVNKLIEAHQMQQIMDSGMAPVFNADDGSELEFDALEESYFLFLNSRGVSKAS